MEKFVGLPRPDRIRFVGPVKDPHKIQLATEFYETDTGVDMPSEQEKSSERTQQITGMINSLLEFARNELKLDLSERVPRAEDFHFFDYETFKELGEMYNTSPDSYGATIDGKVSFVKEDPVVENTMGNSQHELIHISSSKFFELHGNEEELELEMTHLGYQNRRNDVLLVINEVLTEMTNIEIMATYWKKQEALSRMNIRNYSNIGYIGQVIIVDELIKRISRKNGRKYKDVLREMQKGMFLGERQPLRFLTNDVGKNGMKNLAQWKLRQTDVARAAQSLGLTKARAKILALRRGRNIRIMEEISPKIVFKPKRNTPPKVFKLIRGIIPKRTN